MSAKRAVSLALAIGWIGLMAPVNVDAGDQAVAATPWVDAHEARVRLVAGGRTQSGKSVFAGLEITLSEGWKTYWRNPGEAGVPPSFDWSGSSNAASIRVLYPAPIRLSDPAAQMIGYKNYVLLPVEVMPNNPLEGTRLRLALEFAVCREICIPAQAALDLQIPAGERAKVPYPGIATALARVPRSEPERRATDPQVRSVTAKLDGSTPSLAIEASFPGSAAGADLFIEAPDGIFVPMAEKVSGGKPGNTRFRVDLSRGGDAEALRGKQLTLTLVSDAGASETTWTVQ